MKREKISNIYTDKDLSNKIYEKIYHQEKSNLSAKVCDYIVETEESRKKNIINLKKRLSMKLGVTINSENIDEFTAVCRAYFEDKVKIKTKKGEEITFKDLFDEITKEKIKKDNLSEEYIDVLTAFTHFISKNSKIPDPTRLTERCINLWNIINLRNEILDEFSEKIYFKYDDNSIKDVKKILQGDIDSIFFSQDIFVIPIRVIAKNFRDIPKTNITDRIIIFTFLQNYKRRIEGLVELTCNEEAYCKDTKPRYKIPEKSFFTLKEISEIYNDSYPNSSLETLKRIYGRLRVIASQIAISELHKKEGEKAYIIPRSRVINYLYELEIREINNKKINQKTLTLEDLKKADNKEEVKFNQFLFQIKANSINARECNKGKLNNAIRDFQKIFYLSMVSRLSLENLF